MRIVFCRSNPIAPDPRVEKEARALRQAGHEVVVVGWDRTGELPIDEKLDQAGPGSDRARQLREARSSLYSARLDWHRFDLDTITGHLEKMYDTLEKSPEP